MFSLIIVKQNTDCEANFLDLDLYKRSRYLFIYLFIYNNLLRVILLAKAYLPQSPQVKYTLYIV